MEFLLIASAHFLALLSPGPDFFLILQTALRLPTLPHLEVSCSIGVAVSTPGHERFDDLMRRADLALYRAKRNGRSRTELAEADGPDVQAARNRRLPWPQAAE